MPSAVHLSAMPRRVLRCAAMTEGGWWEPPVVNIKKAVGLEFVVAITKSLIGL